MSWKKKTPEQKLKDKLTRIKSRIEKYSRLLANNIITDVEIRGFKRDIALYTQLTGKEI